MQKQYKTIKIPNLCDMIFLFFDNFIAYLYVNHSLSPEKQDYDMKRQEWLRKGRKTEKKRKESEEKRS